MSVTYKDIDQLSQKSSVAGTEKIPVSDTQYVTTEQISGLSGVSVDTVVNGADLDISDENDYSIVRFESGHIKTKHFDSSIAENTSNKVTSLSSSSTDTQYPSAKCVYDGLATKQKSITVSSSEPTSADGSDGDIWIVI